MESRQSIGIGIVIVVALFAIFVYLGNTYPLTSTQTTTMPGSGYGTSSTGAPSTSTAPTTTIGMPTSGGNMEMVNMGGMSFPQSQLAAITITASPANLSQISRISLFRSCAGHDFSGYSFNGTLEANRSMKHYYDIPSSLVGKAHVVQIFSPFNGTLIFDSKTLDYPNGDQIVVQSSSANDMGVEIFHIDLLQNITIGTKVVSGQLLGYKNASEYSGFDIAYGPLNPAYPCGGRCQTPMSQGLDSIFNHMIPQVLAQYAAVGVTPQKVIAMRAFRDANPCHYPNETGYGSSGVNASAWADPRYWDNVT
ncbi:MAG: hypothetical protein KGH49_00130 [Candidatus Micrarchaeota archaeon]|nr:hypothetical protein [Candidatus Micrarchaeota archaeon]